MYILTPINEYNQNNRVCVVCVVYMPKCYHILLKYICGLSIKKVGFCRW